MAGLRVKLTEQVTSMLRSHPIGRQASRAVEKAFLKMPAEA
jgi:hypothetical protein